MAVAGHRKGGQAVRGPPVTPSARRYASRVGLGLPSPPAPRARRRRLRPAAESSPAEPERAPETDRKSTRLNSSHVKISYAVFCLKKKNTPVLQSPSKV